MRKTPSHCKNKGCYITEHGTAPENPSKCQGCSGLRDPNWKPK